MDFRPGVDHALCHDGHLLLVVCSHHPKLEIPRSRRLCRATHVKCALVRIVFYPPIPRPGFCRYHPTGDKHRHMYYTLCPPKRCCRELARALCIMGVVCRDIEFLDLATQLENQGLARVSKYAGIYLGRHRHGRMF